MDEFWRHFFERYDLSDRTLKYGRNIIAESCTILVLFWTPGFNIGEIQVFGYNVTKANAAWAWAGLLIVLFYYSFMFRWLVHSDGLMAAQKIQETQSNSDVMSKVRIKEVEESLEPGRVRVSNIKKAIQQVDISLPAVLLVIAAGTATYGWSNSLS